MTAEKKKYEFMRIIALDGSTIYRSKGLTALKDGKTNAYAFSGVLDDSLETIKLREVYAKHEAEIGYPYLEDKAFCRAIVSVSFDYGHDATAGGGENRSRDRRYKRRNARTAAYQGK